MVFLLKMPIEILPAIIGNAAYIRADNRSRQIHMEIEVNFSILIL